MEARVLRIENRYREQLSIPASLKDFTVQAGEPIDARIVVEQPQLSLYCLDDEARQAIFVELPPEVDLVQAPFYYQAQFDHARRLIAVPYEQLPHLANLLPNSLERLIVIHNIGRCGSTLLHHVLNKVDEVISLSEPDVLSQFVRLRSPKGERDTELVELLGWCARFICKPSLYPKSASTYVFKLRNQCTEIIDLLFQAFPQARHLFLYRAAAGWASSLYRLVARHGPPPEKIPLGEAIQRWSDYSGRPISPAAFGVTFPGETISLVEFAALAWLVMIDRYLLAYQQGFSMPAFRYEDLTAHRAQTVGAIFNYCHLPATAVSEALGAFAADSQRGTRLARSEEGDTVTLNETHLAQIQAILAQYAGLQAPDFVLPGTYLMETEL